MLYLNKMIITWEDEDLITPTYFFSSEILIFDITTFKSAFSTYHATLHTYYVSICEDFHARRDFFAYELSPYR